MARRKIDLSTSGKGTFLDMKTGKPVERPVLPVICERVRFYREKRGMEQKTLAKMIGVTPNTISNWENGRSRPDVNLLPGICKSLDISFYELFDIETPPARYTRRQQLLLENYGQLNDGHRFAVEHLIDSLIKAQDAENLPDIRQLTYYEKSLAAGTGDPTEFDIGGEPLYVYTSPEINRADCVFTVNGSSMEPDFHSGDMVLVKRVTSSDEINYGDIGAFIVGNETYIKKYEEDGLYSLNPNYRPMKFDETQRVYLIGRVTGVLDPRSIASESDVDRYESVYGESELSRNNT